MARAKKTQVEPEKKQKVNEAWNEVLVANEKAKKGDRLTDSELVAEMQERFPAKAEKTTITRISMIRSCYNKGTNMFAKLGASGTSSRPISKKYDEEGNIVPGRGEGKAPAEKKAPAKKTVKKAPAKEAKKPARRAAKGKGEEAAKKPARRRRTAAK